MTDPGAPLAAIERLPLAVAMRHDLWLYPIVEIFHIVGFVTLVGSIIVLDLRLLGLSKALPVQVLARHVLPWSFAALIVIAARSTHQGPIEVATGGSAPILTLALAPIEETAVASRIARVLG